MGRPNEYNEAVFTELMEEIASGLTLKHVCESDDKYPSPSTVRRWVIDNVQGCSARYTQAREMGMHAMVDETIAISDDTTRDTTVGEDGHEAPNNEWIQRSRLRVDTRKWLASKVIPKIYGERTQHELTGADGGPLVVTWAGQPPKV
jgi:hypothetical protein